jgi:signal transduction histidine kinase
VFENLLRNAMIHSGDAVGIRVLARQVDGDQIMVSVSDSGPGIDEARSKTYLSHFSG